MASPWWRPALARCAAGLGVQFDLPASLPNHLRRWVFAEVIGRTIPIGGTKPSASSRVGVTTKARTDGIIFKDVRTTFCAAPALIPQLRVRFASELLLAGKGATETLETRKCIGAVRTLCARLHAIGKRVPAVVDFSAFETRLTAPFKIAARIDTRVGLTDPHPVAGHAFLANSIADLSLRTMTIFETGDAADPFKAKLLVTAV